MTLNSHRGPPGAKLRQKVVARPLPSSREANNTLALDALNPRHSGLSSRLPSPPIKISVGVIDNSLSNKADTLTRLEPAELAEPEVRDYDS